jgi:heterodisulfide reductase subunit D
MGLHRHDRFKELKIMQDADLIVEECRDLIAEHSLDPELARDVVARAMLGEQPLPLMGGMMDGAGDHNGGSCSSDASIPSTRLS